MSAEKRHRSDSSSPHQTVSQREPVDDPVNPAANDGSISIDSSMAATTPNGATATRTFQEDQAAKLLQVSADVPDAVLNAACAVADGAVANTKDACDQQVVSPVIALESLQGKGNRARFLAGVHPTQITCDLRNLPITPGLRFSFYGTIVVVYPPSSSPPERCYILLADDHGTTGITLWNAHVKQVGSFSVGCCAKFTRLALSTFNGKKSLTMGKDSTLTIESPYYTGPESLWWRSVLKKAPLTASQFHEARDDDVVNVCGILGHISVEQKTVRGDSKNVVVLHLTDKTGNFEVRSWSHANTDQFLRYRERPIRIQRIRVSQYGSQKVGELLDGPGGSQFSEDFPETEGLAKYWDE